MFKVIKVMIALLALLISSAPLHAATYGFDDITNNGPYNDLIGQYLSVDVSELVDSNVLFTFNNSSTNNTGGIIRNIYFSNVPVYFSSFVSIANTTNVNFSEGSNPANLPGDPSLNWGLSADADTPQPINNGIGAGESLKITLGLSGGKSYSDLLTALEGGSFYMGLHVQSFSGGSSESLVSIPGDGGEGGSGVVPIPAAIWLFGSALLGLMGVSRKKNTLA